MSMNRYIMLLLLVSTLIHAKIVGGIAVLVQDEPITLFEIKEMMQRENLSLKQSVQKLIRHKLEALEIKTRHIVVTPQEVLRELKAMAQQNGMDLTQFYMAMSRSRGISERELKTKVKENLLNKKLYQTITYSKLTPPSSHEIEEYYRLHKAQFVRPESFEVILYHSRSAEKLQQQVTSPMFYSPDIHTESLTLHYGAIDPNLANLIYQTKINNFTPIIPDPKGGYMTFFVKEKSKTQTDNIEAYTAEVSAAILADKRTQLLNDYFSRLRLNADIKTLRLPKG